jgi:hypothetical protein
MLLLIGFIPLLAAFVLLLSACNVKYFKNNEFFTIRKVLLSTLILMTGLYACVQLGAPL